MSVHGSSTAAAGAPSAAQMRVPRSAADPPGASAASSGALRAGVSAPILPWQRTSPLFRKYAIFIAALVGGALLVSGSIEAYFSFLEQRATLVRVQQEKAVATAATIEQFAQEIERQLDWAMPPPWVGPSATMDQRRSDYRRLLRQAPSVTDVRYVDRSGRERLRVSRLSVNARETLDDYTADPRFLQLIAGN